GHQELGDRAELHAPDERRDQGEQAGDEYQRALDDRGVDSQRDRPGDDARVVAGDRRLVQVARGGCRRSHRRTVRSVASSSATLRRRTPSSVCWAMPTVWSATAWRSSGLAARWSTARWTSELCRT